jgi:Predicted membrane protein
MDQHEQRLHAIAAHRWRIAFVLSAIMLTAYYGFILLVAFDKPLLSTQLTDGLSLGILLGALVIVFAWALTMFYTKWANSVYDREIAELSHLSR